jgi:hypothetical protein
MKLRWWIERSVIVVAAVAAMATSKRKWHVPATLPPDAATGARIYTVEASLEPVFRISSTPYHLKPMEPATWPGKARYLVPSDARVEVVELYGTCSGGFCGGKTVCEPEGSYIRVASVEAIATWKLEVLTPTVGTIVTSPMKERSRFKLTASHPPRLFLESPHVRGSVAERSGYVFVEWGFVDKPVETASFVKAVIEGQCPGADPCEPPADAKLELGPEERVPLESASVPQ